MSKLYGWKKPGSESEYAIILSQWQSSQWLWPDHSIIELTPVERVAEQVTDDHFWAFEYANQPGQFVMVFSRYDMLDVCFEYGVQRAVANGHGRIVRLVLIEGEVVRPAQELVPCRT